ncbi:MAG: methyltransferase domain-containing protein [Paenibacillaceae bacterium]|nr:methyltransferase domain-containing protein [Paenibacillaceae bacterium]
MVHPLTKRVQRAFGQCAATYDDAADVQQRMVRTLCPLCPAHAQRILEIGCGTGMLTEALLARYPDAHVTAVDVAPEMAVATSARCAAHVDRLATIVGDGEHVHGTPPYDLICTSAAMQWFVTPRNTVARLIRALRPNGQFVFATFVDGTLAELKHAFEIAERTLDMGHCRRVNDFVRMDELRSWCAPHVHRVEQHDIVICVPDAMALIRRLKRLGAHVVARPHDAPFHRDVFVHMARAYAECYGVGDGVRVTYRIAYGVVTKGEHV